MAKNTAPAAIDVLFHSFSARQRTEEIQKPPEPRHRFSDATSFYTLKKTKKLTFD
jgi:hypothetical protein